MKFGRSTGSVVAKELDRDLEVSEFELQSPNEFIVRLKLLGKA